MSALVETDGAVVLDFQIEILRDAAQTATRYWKNMLWALPHEPYTPDIVLYERFGAQYGYGGVEEAWNRWFVVLTSDDYFGALTGLDIERIDDDYGKTPNRS